VVQPQERGGCGTLVSSIICGYLCLLARLGPLFGVACFLYAPDAPSHVDRTWPVSTARCCFAAELWGCSVRTRHCCKCYGPARYISLLPGCCSDGGRFGRPLLHPLTEAPCSQEGARWSSQAGDVYC
jgi:hypothetical protein